VSVDHVRDQRPQRRADDPIILRPRGPHLRRYATARLTLAVQPSSGRVCRSAWKGPVRPQPTANVRWQCCAVLCARFDASKPEGATSLHTRATLKVAWRKASAGNVTLAKLRLKHAVQ
jgi:hypothetical protein